MNDSLTQYNLSDAAAADLGRRFMHHAPHGDQVARYGAIRKELLMVAISLSQLCPPSRELSLAQTHLEQAMMWANAAIARNENPTP